MSFLNSEILRSARVLNFRWDYSVLSIEKFLDVIPYSDRLFVGNVLLIIYFYISLEDLKC